jgi:hypothetical protein
MNLTIKRLPSDEHRTHGDLFIDGEWECYTLEDPVRDVKIKGETAIPFGRYPITLENSPRFGPGTITVNNVDNFVGVRIHGGNNEHHTAGCPLVGQARAVASILQSAAALTQLKSKVAAALMEGEHVWLDIVNADIS